MSDDFKIGTQVHALDENGDCNTGTISRWDAPQRQAEILALRFARGEGFSDTWWRTSLLHHDASGSVGFAPSFHLPEECRWER